MIRTILRTIAYLPGILVQLVGMILTLVGWGIMATGLLLRLIGATMSGSLIVTRGLVRAIQAARA